MPTSTNPARLPCILPGVMVILMLSARATVVKDSNEDSPAFEPSEERVLQYSRSSDLADPVAELQHRIRQGQTRLDHDPARGYLPAILRALNLPISSQVLVFSKTSSQARHTSPRTPRAIYFNDRVLVGWAPDSPTLDLAGIDPAKGPVFYTLDQAPDRPTTFQRPTDCLSCHKTSKTLDVPGLLVRSVYTQPDGTATAMVDGFISGHNSPLHQRWGGWYVTGTHAGDRHLGNTFLREQDAPNADLSGSSQLTSLAGRFDTSRYLSPHSDTVALLVLDHMVRMQVLITRARFETLLALDEMARAPANPAIAAWSQRRIAAAAEALLACMLFRDEAPLKGRVRGTSAFEREFQAQGPRDTRGRSLRAFDLERRVFKFPCSFMVHSPGFEGLPLEMKDHLWRRLDAILQGADRSRLFGSFSAGERTALLEILEDTVPQFREHRRTGRHGGQAGPAKSAP